MIVLQAVHHIHVYVAYILVRLVSMLPFNPRLDPSYWLNYMYIVGNYKAGIHTYSCRYQCTRTGFKSCTYYLNINRRYMYVFITSMIFKHLNMETLLYFNSNMI